MKALLQEYVQQLHLDPRKPFPSEIKQGVQEVLERKASYPDGKGAVVLLFKSLKNKDGGR